MNSHMIALKNALIQIHERTKPELFARLISKTRMTGRPSNYLQELMSIADKVGVGEDLVKHQFTSAFAAIHRTGDSSTKGYTATTDWNAR